MTDRPSRSAEPSRWAVLSLYRGGMLHVAAGLANSLAASDPGARVACFGPAELPSSLFDPRVERHASMLPEALNFAEAGRWLGCPLAAQRLARRVRMWRPTLLHLNSGHWLHPLLVPAWARHIPLVATLHDVTPHPGERRPHHGWKLRALLTHARRIIVHSADMRTEAIARWSLPPERVVVLPLVSFGHCVTRLQAPAPPRHPADVLLYGRIYAYKGYDTFFRAWPAIAARVPEARVTLAGAGDLGPWRAALAAAGDRVRVLNRFIGEEETARLFAETALPVLPYTQASQSGVALLAAAHGRAVVASRVGAIPEVVRHGETGWLVPPGDPAALADAVVHLLRQPALREELGRRARDWTEENFGPVVSGRRLLDLYGAVLRENPPPGGA
jgi:glycosyltransferase involved in cell wall biosynthesis